MAYSITDTERRVFEYLVEWGEADIKPMQFDLRLSQSRLLNAILNLTGHTDIYEDDDGMVFGLLTDRLYNINGPDRLEPCSDLVEDQKEFDFEE